MPGRLVLLATTPRVAPGLLSWAAWSALRSADVVLVASVENPLLPALADAGVPVRVLARATTDVAMAEQDPLDPAGPDRAEPDAGTAHGDVLVADRATTILAELRWPGADGVPGGARDSAAAGPTVVWVMSADGDPGLAEAIAREARPDDDVAVELVSGSWDLRGARLLDLVAVMDRLRSPGGCPWDAEQTHTSLVEYLLEEAYETVEAIETGEDSHLREELGDLLLQIVFHARIAEEHERSWGIDEVADGIVEKLVARHPHVFGDDVATTAEQVEATWQIRKNAEKGRSSVTDGVPVALPSLVLAAKLLKRAASLGVAPVAPEVASAADTAVSAVRTAYAESEAIAYGDLLLALVAQARADDVDADTELRAAARRYRARVRTAEGLH